MSYSDVKGLTILRLIVLSLFASFSAANTSYSPHAGLLLTGNVEGGPTLNQHLVNISCLVGHLILP